MKFRRTNAGKKSYKDDSDDEEENKVSKPRSPFGELGNLNKTSLSTEMSGHVSYVFLPQAMVL